MPKKYDLIIRNGRVIDFSQNLDEVRDLYIHKGVMFPPPEDGGPGVAIKEIDASDCIVTPGLIDAHTHLYYGGTGRLSTDADISCLPNCVTTGVDAGSTGIWNFEGFVRSEMAHSLTTIRALLHPCVAGVQVKPEEENENPANFPVTEIVDMFKKYPHILRGLKIRMGKGTVREHGMGPIRKTQEIAEKIRAEGLQCNVGVHFNELADGVTMDEFMDSFRENDILFHMYHPDGDAIFNPDGTIMDCVLRARERGVLFDSCRGCMNFSIENVCKAAAQGFFPDIISTDLGLKTLYRRPNFSILNSMSLMRNAGMDLLDVLRAVTYTPAKAYGLLDEAASLALGRKADVAIIREITMEKEYADLYGGRITGDRLLMPMACIKDGRTVFQQIFMD